MRLAVLSALLTFPVAANAHGMFAEAKVKDGTVRVEVFYEDNDPAKGAVVKVFNAAKEVVLEGKTDDAGVWTFAAPPPGQYTVNAKHTGHAAKGEFEIVAPDAPPPTPTQPTREELTGPQRWLWVAGGVAVVAVVFVALYLVVRKKK